MREAERTSPHLPPLEFGRMSPSLSVKAASFLEEVWGIPASVPYLRPEVASFLGEDGDVA